MSLTAIAASLPTAEVPITADNVRPGWVALGIVFALAVGLVLLVRSMSRHLKRAEQPWEGDPDQPSDEASADSSSPSSR